MASNGSGLWWITPLQCLTTLSTAINFGASGFQTPITMPVLRSPEVPAHHAATLVTNLLRIAENIFPKLNAIGTVGNLAMTVTLLLKRDGLSPTEAAKLPYTAAAFALSASVTVYALTVMVPINTTMKDMAKRLKTDENDKEAAQTFREYQEKWQNWNMGRAYLMLCGAVVSIIGLVR